MTVGGRDVTGEFERRECWTLHRCADCGWVTFYGSIHGCVSCLTKREPEPFYVVPAEDLAAAVEALDGIAMMTHQDIDRPASWWGLISDVHHRARRGLGELGRASRRPGDEEET